MPCSLNKILSFSPRVVCSFKTLFIVSFILFIWPRNASLFAVAASSRATVSSSRFFNWAVISTVSSSRFFNWAVISLLLISSSASCTIVIYVVLLRCSYRCHWVWLLVSSPHSRRVRPSVCVFLLAISGNSNPKLSIIVVSNDFTASSNSPILLFNLCTSSEPEKSCSGICTMERDTSPREEAKACLAIWAARWVIGAIPLLYFGRFSYWRTPCVPPSPTSLLYSLAKELRERNVAGPCFAVILISLSPTTQYSVFLSSDNLNWS